MWLTLLSTLHIISAVLLIISILIQPDRSMGIGGGASHFSQTLFGSQGSISFITKVTSGLAFLFFATSFGLNLFHVNPMKIKQSTTISAVSMEKKDNPV